MQVPKGLGDVETLMRRFTKASAEWEHFRELYQEAADYSTPHRNNFTEYSSGQQRNQHVFDSTAILGLEQFASRIQGALMPSWQEWVSLVAGDEIPEEEKDRVNVLLEDVTKALFMALNHSNFSTEISPSLIDLGLGTGGIQIEEGEFKKGEILRFTNIPLTELYPERPPHGAIESTWRCHQVEAAHLKRTWPEADMPTQLMDLAKRSPMAMVKIYNGNIYNPEDSKYHQVVIHPETKTLLYTQAFETKRIIVFRWHVTPGEVFGRGPIVQVLPDIKTLNVIKRFMLENAALQMSGIYTAADDGFFNPNTVRLTPGSIIPVKSNASANPSLAPLQRSGDLGLGSILLEDLQAVIRKALFTDPFGEINDPVRSATEVMLRQQEMLKTSGASIGRLKSELVEPLINAAIEILAGLGRVPEISVNGKEVTIKQNSPLAKAEDLEDFQNTQVWMQTLQTLPPEVVAGTVRMEQLPKFWQEKLGIPASLIRSAEEQQQLAQQVTQAASQSIEQGGAFDGGGGGAPAPVQQP